MSKNIDDWTVERLRKKCKNDGLENYGKLTLKEDLFRYCILGQPLDSILYDRENRVKKTKKAEAKIMVPDIGDCTVDEPTARRCFSIIVDRYPSIFQSSCQMAIEGPAIGAIVDRGRMIGIVDAQGDAIPVAPPLPPPPPEFLPRVETKNKTEKNQLKVILTMKKTEGENARDSNLLSQLQNIKLKKAECTMTNSPKKPMTVSETLIEQMKAGVQLKKVDLDKVKENKQARKDAEREGTILGQISRGYKLKSVPKPQEKSIGRILPSQTLRLENGSFDSSDIEHGPCNHGLYWDPKLKKCIPIQVDADKEDVRQAIEETVKEEKQGNSSSCSMM